MRKIAYAWLLLFIGITLKAQIVGPGDWTSVRLYGHAYDVDDFSEEEYEWIANHFYYFTIEKRHAYLEYGATSSERASAATAAKLVTLNSKCHPLFYWNTKVVYETIYETIQEALAIHPEWASEGADGGNWTYQDAEFRTWFVDVVKDMVNNYAHDGVFLDGALSVGGHISAQAGRYLRDMLAEMPGPTIFNGFGPNTSNGRFDYLENAEGVFLEHFFKSQCDNLAKGKKMLDDLLLVPNDKIILANSAPEAFWNTTDHNFSLAAFLIIANDNSYYHWMPDHSWSSQNLMFWHEDFGKTIGKPLGKAKVDGYVYTRTFENVSVRVDLQNKTSSLNWIDNSVYDPDPIANLALRGTATQSSTNHGGIASRANDDNTNGAFGQGSVTHTLSEDKPWWQVDLGASYHIGEISVFNRTDGTTSARLSSFTIYVLDEDSVEAYSKSFDTYPDPSVTMNAGGVKGRYVVVQLNGTGALSLAEVKVAESLVSESKNAVIVKMVDASTNDSIPLASFVLNGQEYTANYVGKMALELPDNNYSFTLSKEGYVSLSGTLNITKDTLLMISMEAISSNTFSVNSDKITVFPNPAKHQVYIESGSNSMLSYEFYNIGGELKLSGKLNQNIKSIDTSSCASGVYFVKINQNTSVTTQKIVLQ